MRRWKDITAGMTKKLRHYLKVFIGYTCRCSTHSNNRAIRSHKESFCSAFKRSEVAFSTASCFWCARIAWGTVSSSISSFSIERKLWIPSNPPKESYTKVYAKSLDKSSPLVCYSFEKCNICFFSCDWHIFISRIIVLYFIVIRLVMYNIWIIASRVKKHSK